MSDRLAVALEAAVKSIFPSLAAYLQWEYRVVDVTPGPPVLISGTPVETDGQFACPFGPLANITLWPDTGGGYATPLPGSLILIAFNDGNPAKPRVSRLDPGSYPTSIKLGGPAPQPIALAPALTTLMGLEATWAAAVSACLENLTGGPGPINGTSAQAPLTATLTTAAGLLATGYVTAETATPSLVTESQ